MQITFSTNVFTGPLLSGNSFNDTTDAATFSTTEGGTFVWATHLTTETLTANGSGGWTGNLLESGTDTVATSGETTITAIYTATTGTGGESRKFSYYVRNASGNDSNVITESFTVNSAYSGPTYQGISSILNSPNGPLPWPTHTSGDIAILAYSASGVQATPTAPTGFTHLGVIETAPGDDGSHAHLDLWYRVATSASESDAVISSGVNFGAWQMITLRGGTTVTLKGNGEGTTSSVSIAGGTITANSAFVAAVASVPSSHPIDNISAWTNADLDSGMTDRSGGSLDYFGSIRAIDFGVGETAAGGTIGATTATISSGNWAGFTVEVN